jgi:hypothetical protein
MSAVTNKTGVEVCIWIAKDSNGKYTDAAKGVSGGRVGHASVKIYPSEIVKRTYSSLIRPGKDHIYVSLWPGCFNQTHEDDIRDEGGKPESIIRLNKLDTKKMVEELNKVIDVARWSMKGKATTPLAKSAESCASFVYKLLEIGGIFEKAVYGGNAKYKGPGWNFYYATNCHLGDIAGGVFNSFGWRDWVISPKLVLHFTAAAAESNSTDKEETLSLMKSRQVISIT